VHAAAVVPHLLHQNHGLAQGIPLDYRWSIFRLRFVHAVAVGAVPAVEHLLATRRVTGLVEESRGVEECEQVGGGFRAQLWFLDPRAFDRRPHHRRMVPHGAGQQRRSEAAIDALAQVGTHFSTLPVDAVALDATLALKKLFATLGVTRNYR